ncbi:MAG: PSD1 and planctomycete cytochrome C domain-containing protein [Limisphaerales bacterium]
MFALSCLLLSASGKAADPKAEAIPANHAEQMAKGMALFKSQIGPILNEHCLRCHGGEKVKSHFNIATRESLLKGGDNGPDVLPGKAQESLLYQLITHQKKPHMPAKGEPLTAAMAAQIAQWIDFGAPYDQPLVKDPQAVAQKGLTVTDDDREFWAFQPLKREVPPAVKQSQWARTPIDRFILARLEQEHLTPNPATDRRRLVRRVYLDLIGLPPTPEQVENFVNDPAPDAYARLVDQLLASPRYGERWAAYWLDVVRFAESMGYEQDYNLPYAYHYRDFVMQALNADMPYDRFVRWQLAGDEMAPEDPRALMATGFLTVGAFPTQLTEAEFESARYDQLDDMTQTTGAAFLGLTVGCARCHDHKYDPIPTKDYYRLAAAFGTAIRSDIDVDVTRPEEKQRAEDKFRVEQAKREGRLHQFEQQELPGLFQRYLDDARQNGVKVDPWTVLDLQSIEAPNGTRFVKQPDGSLLATGAVPDRDLYTFVAETRLTGITAVRLEALADPSLPHQGPGRADNGNFTLGDFRVSIAPLEGNPASEVLKFTKARATHEQNQTSLSVAASIDGDPISGWAVDGGGIGKTQAAVFQTERPFGYAQGTKVTFTLRFDHPNKKHAIGRPRLALTTASPEGDIYPPKGPAPALVSLLEKLAQREPVTPEQQTEARAWFVSTLPRWRELKKSADDHRKAGPDRRVVKIQVTSEGLKPVAHHADERGFPHFYPQTYFLKRGDVHQKDGVANEGFLQVLMRGGKDPSYWEVKPSEGWRTSYRRRSLANWMTDVEFGAGHLLARVIVNRLWQHHFGQGLVATPNDFGAQGDRPTHPELLDWLAEQLVENGWHLKPIQRLILTSAAYLQSTDFDDARSRRDSEDRLLWRFPPRRLEAETIRDSMLAVSGLLDDRMYGPGSLDQNMRRRSIYFTIKRSELIPVMMLFDWPEHLVSIGSRSSTTIASQALMFMNSPQIRQYAEGLADRLAKAQQEHKDVIREGYRIAVGREPNPHERELAEKFLEHQTVAYTADGRDHARHPALTDFCQTLMSLNEFLYLE